MLKSSMRREEGGQEVEERQGDEDEDTRPTDQRHAHRLDSSCRALLRSRHFFFCLWFFLVKLYSKDSIASLKCSSIQHEVHLVNDGPHEAEYALGRGLLWLTGGCHYQSVYSLSVSLLCMTKRITSLHRVPKVKTFPFRRMIESLPCGGVCLPTSEVEVYIYVCPWCHHFLQSLSEKGVSD